MLCHARFKGGMGLESGGCSPVMSFAAAGVMTPQVACASDAAASVCLAYYIGRMREILLTFHSCVLFLRANRGRTATHPVSSGLRIINLLCSAIARYKRKIVSDSSNLITAWKHNFDESEPTCMPSRTIM